jgi:hypothetical protein
MVAKPGRYLSTLAILGMACGGCAGPVFGVVQPSRNVSIAHIPQVAVSGSSNIAPHHRRYPANSPGYIYRDFRTRRGVFVPYRLGDNGYGLTMVTSRYGTASSVVAATVEHGRLYHSSRNPSIETYVAWFYNPLLPTSDPYRDVNIEAVVSLAPMQDGLPKGVISADALHYHGKVPGWIAGPNSDICVFGGPGMAPNVIQGTKGP